MALRVEWLRTVGREELPPELRERVDVPATLDVVHWEGAARSIETLLADR